MELGGEYRSRGVEVIPNDWVDLDITQLVDKSNGIKIGPFGSQIKKELLTETGFKVYGQENVFERDMDIGNRYISKEHFKNLSTCELSEGDFIISMMGTIGKCMIVPKLNEPGIMDSHLIRLRLNKNKIDPELLLHFFSSDILIKQVKKLSVGGIMEGLSSKIVKKIVVPLPPTKEEQTAIANVLSDADELINSLENLIAKKRNIKQGAMQELLTGKKRLPGFSGKWEVKKLGEIVDFANGKAHENVISDNGKFIVVNSKFISSEGKVVKFSDYNFCPANIGEVLMVMSDIPNGKAIAKCFLVDKNDKYTVNQRICLLKPVKVDSTFLFYALNRHPFYLAFDDGVKQTNLRKEDVLDCQLNLPFDKIEQTAIVQILSDMDAEIEALEQKLAKYKMIKQGMMQVLLTGKVRLV